MPKTVMFESKEMELVDFKKAHQFQLKQLQLANSKKAENEEKNRLAEIKKIEVIEQSRLAMVKEEEELEYIHFYSMQNEDSPKKVIQVELTDFKKSDKASLFFQYYNGLHQLDNNIQAPRPDSPMADTDASNKDRIIRRRSNSN